MPPSSSFHCIPPSASEIEFLVVWKCRGTEIPYPSSQTNMASGTFNTPAAFTVSQKCPSLVEASPIVQNTTSFPPLLNFSNPSRSTSTFRYILLACPSPSARPICPAVGEISEEDCGAAVRSFHSPSSSSHRVP